MKNLHETLEKLTQLPRLSRKEVSEIIKAVYQQGREDERGRQMKEYKL